MQRVGLDDLIRRTNDLGFQLDSSLDQIIAAPATTAADAALFDLHEKMRNLQGQSSGSDDKNDRLADEQGAITDCVSAIPATTLQSLAVKVLTLCRWMDVEDDIRTDEQEGWHNTDAGITGSTGRDAKRLLDIDRVVLSFDESCPASAGLFIAVANGFANEKRKNARKYGEG